jgi:hypothetical protein
MKILLYGSLMVVFGVITLAAMEWVVDGVTSGAVRTDRIQPVFRTVNLGGDRNGARRQKAVVWQTSTGPEDCASVLDRRERDAAEKIAELIGSAASPSPKETDAETCAPFHLGEVDPGTQVEVLDDFGRVAKVRFLSGVLDGREGFIENDRLSGEDR